MEKRLYDENMYRFHEPQPSYWEATAGVPTPAAPRLEADDDCDVAIIGGGYTGLSAAYHLARDHSIDARVLEAGHIGWGASGRNGGFCTMGGSAMNDDALAARHGIDELRHYYRSQIDAVERVRTILSDENIDASPQGDAELEVAHTRRAWRELREHCAWQRDQLGLDAVAIPAAEFRANFFDSAEQFGAVRLRPSFGLHPLRYHLGLAAAAARRGAALHADSEVLAWRRDGERHVLATAQGSLRARFVIVAANGFMPEGLHPLLRGRVMPLISAIVVTRPLTEDELSRYGWRTECPSINARVLLNYFRLLPDRRLLFGGRGHSTGTAAGSARHSRALLERLVRIWPKWRDLSVDYAWHGLIGMTRRLTPVVARATDDPSIFLAFGYHGNGVNTATWCGQQLAAWLAADGRSGNRFENGLPAMVRGVPARFPLSSVRLWYLQAILAGMRMRDRLG